ncbi:family 43 glycosylhydrolase [Nakamurella lactea]|uniref:family 43 glycosylhydrolase n=1 Tax=Nakamurella lactea TaxID=459515 RepID=UPI00041D9488|nr:family 43 glycosylhydrolase [Nakamurella lactea]
MGRARVGRLVAAVLLALSATVFASGIAQAIEIPKDLIAQNFPDPDVVPVNGTWYAYSTNTWAYLPVASAPTVDGPWSLQGDAMPGGPSTSWATAGRTWAPDVAVNSDGTLTVTYTAWHTASGRQCIGVAKATSPLGPFTPVGTGPLLCPLAQGGAIDASTFVEPGGSRYLLWKNDGNAVGVSSSIYLAPVNSDGTALTGSPTALITGPAGSIIEAPVVVRRPTGYAMFVSTGGYGGCDYQTAYATSTSLNGPWTGPTTFMTTGNTGVCGPGGADVKTATNGLTGGDKVIFHGWVNGARHLFSIDLSWNGLQPVQGGSRASSLDGDGRAEIAAVRRDGEVQAWHNDLGFAVSPYGDSLFITTGFDDPARTRFADLDDDGRAEAIYITTNGEIWAWHNDAGFASNPFGTSRLIATGFTDPARVRFADLDDDGRAELINIAANGDVTAWHNDAAFATAPYGAFKVVATGFSADRTLFGDLDGDGRAEIMDIRPNGEIWAWHNDAGFATTPYGNSALIADGFIDPERVRVADLDQDGRVEMISIQPDGQVRAWHNDTGFTDRPYGDSVIIADGFTEPDRVIFI